MSTLVTTPTPGLEEIQRAALVQLMGTLNDALAEVEAHWAASDASLAALRGLPYEPTLLERVAPENFHEGHRPSLIKAPIDRYPNVSVMCHRATPSPGSDFDHLEVHRDVLWIEAMVKHDSSEEACNRRAQRMASALYLCVMSSPTLGGVVSGLDPGPTINISDLFTRKENTAYGPHWFWQGARLEYAVRKEAVHPSSSESFFRTTSPQYDIDQA